ncbi:uncharacterized protein LACBIDRAFT_336351 [Laccaria bicolor S238N-H82]|uniref:Predicted protein n=1 Tax=Laccaria bicolor (strain S238N-H82 / ATCC MYA-4686) TaxID=486041 RepID=B0E575_LACBS|nr:uncharacterized protein LACBIDRAFT_336351 [Laccaria bicolor S238N-H82]EDQ98006.1 predicted protein [Laccaria bicolor S238N-H82]|eukprot:XP_001891343.1 predicted protein [Laccaria bicolor S238N-H82]
MDDKAVQDLRKGLGEDVTSIDMMVAVIDPGDPFNPTYMEDGYGEELRLGPGRSPQRKLMGQGGWGHGNRSRGRCNSFCPAVLAALYPSTAREPSNIGEAILRNMYGVVIVPG